MQAKLAVLFCALAAAWLPSAAAQQAARGNPADPAARVPAPQYSSAFTGYQALRDEPPLAWQSANDEVARVGGHLGILRAAPTPARPAASTGTIVKPASGGGHHGHHGGQP
jgi:hypothetical protein